MILRVMLYYVTLAGSVIRIKLRRRPLEAMTRQE